MKIEVIIDKNGDILYNRDNQQVVDILENIAKKEDLQKVLKFIKEKPLNEKGEKDYVSFCG
jgi:hypothetical protein